VDEKYQVIKSRSFEKSLKEIEKKYLKKNRHAQKEFHEKLQEIEKLLMLGKLMALKYNVISFPCKHLNSINCHAIKIKFFVDSIKGTAGHIRIIGIQCLEQEKFIFLRIYTHEKFQKQPPNSVLKDDYVEVFEDC